MTMPPEAFIAYSSPGRFRVRIPALKGNPAALGACGEKCAACPGVETVDTNAATGSLLFLHRTTSVAILDFARSKDLFVVREPGRALKPDPANFRRDVRETFKNADQQIRKLTGGEMDLSGVAIVALIGAGSIQILEGSAGALPWFAAFWYAFNLVTKTKETDQ